MILILSQAHLEPSTEEVMDWIERLGGRCLRLNGEDLEGGSALAFTVDGDGARLRIELGGAGGIGADGAGGAGGPAGDDGDDGASVAVPLDEVRAVWFRRWIAQRRHETVELLDLPWPGGGAGTAGDGAPAVGATGAAGAPRAAAPPRSPLDDDPRLDWRLRSHLTRESRKLADFFFVSLAGRPWLSHPGRASPAKLDVLARAARLGLPVPATLVTTEREELRRFCARHGEIVTKPIAEVELFVHGGRRHFMYTAALDGAAVERLPERFAPSLFQERLAKSCELRVFFLDGACHAMAIFSQRDALTRVDFRNYNHERPNRTVPYRLRPATAAALARLMEELELETGSIDLVRAPGGEEVFLEVNPVGQFGMVSKPCNYQLERKIAEHLLRLAGEPPAAPARTARGET